MFFCQSCYICGTWRSKKVGGLKLSCRGKERSHKQKKLLLGAILPFSHRLKFLEHPFLLSLTVTVPKSVKVVDESKKDKSDISRLKVVVQFSHLFKKWYVVLFHWYMHCCLEWGIWNMIWSANYGSWIYYKKENARTSCQDEPRFTNEGYEEQYSK